ncbi:MAG: 8-amino-7-oxononanoate synthase [Rikenellaceae bacterium]|nr:8-amino-7-oxononanoate synthase [Rikenellaceae bacterium]
MDRYADALYKLKTEGSLRTLRNLVHDGAYVMHKGRRMLDLSSNDYLGIGSSNTLWHEFFDAESLRREFGGGACSSRLLTGNHSAYHSFEKKLARLYGSEDALVFVSGYHANIGILPALAGPKDLILADKLVHASIIDGIRLSNAKFLRYRHNDYNHLDSILEKYREDYDKVFIATESVFSMDGDKCDIPELVRIKNKYDTLLYIDEAHAIGTCSDAGLGVSHECGCAEDVDLLVGTFGKAVASQGAFVILSRIMKEYLVNTMRPLIFSTALPPLSVRWTEFVMDRISGMNERRKHLQNISGILRSKLIKAGFATCGDSNIVPIILGDNDKTIRLSDYLCGNGFFILPIHKPTVPAGSERLRISLTAAIEEQNINDLIEACKRFGI